MRMSIPGVFTGNCVGRYILSALILAGLTVAVSALLFFSQGVPEPKYQGVPLSAWLDGTMAKRNLTKMFLVINSVGPEALPWLVQAAEGEPGFKYVLHQKYSHLYKSSSLVRRLLPNPGSDLSDVAHHNILNLLARLAPGTAYEERALSAILRPLRASKPHFVEVRCEILAHFTNCPTRVLPMLLIALTNVSTVDSAVLGFQRFGTSATSILYPMALSETGFVRPAELALKKADPAAYEKLLTARPDP
jgi:hypothetical protein